MKINTSHKPIFLSLLICTFNVHYSMHASQPQSNQFPAPPPMNLNSVINSNDDSLVCATLKYHSPNTKIAGVPILLLATLRGKNITVEKLLGHQTIDYNATDLKGNTAAHWAAYTGNIDALISLKVLGANLTIENNNRNNPLAIALAGTLSNPNNKQYADCVTLLMNSDDNEEEKEDEESFFFDSRNSS